MEINEFQKLMRQLYFKNDYERGVLKTALWLIEEIGELARAIVKDGSHEELEEELADIFAWTASLANILNIDLVTEYYADVKEYLEYVNNILLEREEGDE